MLAKDEAFALIKERLARANREESGSGPIQSLQARGLMTHHP
jgi:hypothetical protein